MGVAETGVHRYFAQVQILEYILNQRSQSCKRFDHFSSSTIWVMVSVRLLSFILTGCLLHTVAVYAKESFNENLLIRPLRDGKVASTFSFTTLLEGASPRNPQSLGGEDICTWSSQLN